MEPSNKQKDQNFPVVITLGQKKSLLPINPYYKVKNTLFDLLHLNIAIYTRDSYL